MFIPSTSYTGSIFQRLFPQSKGESSRLTWALSLIKSFKNEKSGSRSFFFKAKSVDLKTKIVRLVSGLGERILGARKGLGTEIEKIEEIILKYINPATPLEGIEGVKTPPNNARGELNFEFKGPDGKYGAEEAVPRSSREEKIDSLIATKTDTKKRLRGVIGGERRALERIINRCDRAIKSLKEQTGTYCASFDGRSYVEKGGDPKDFFSSELTNCFEEIVKDKDGKVIGSFLRFGAITDKIQGLISYKVFKEIDCLKKLQQGKEVQKKLKEIEIRQEEVKSLIEQEKERIGNFKTKLEKKGKLTEAQEKVFNETFEALDTTIDPQTGISPLDKAFEDRQFLLQQQALAFLDIQVKSHGAEVKGNKLQLFQLSLLNPSKKAIDKRGVVQFEGNEMLDEAGIFEQLDGVTVKLDASDPSYIDAGGVYHLKKFDTIKTDTIDIATHFVNVVPQGSVKKDDRPLYKEAYEKGFGEMEDLLEKKRFDLELMKGWREECRSSLEPSESALASLKGKFNKSQQQDYNGPKPADVQFIKEVLNKYNEEVIDALIDKDIENVQSMQKTLQKCKTAIEGGKAHFSIAKDIAKISHFLGWNLSINCHSGKDRTGYVSFQYVLHMLERDLEEREGCGKKFIDLFSSVIYNSDSIPMKIVRLNGYIALKIHPLKQIIKNSKSLIGIIKNSALGAKELLKSKRRSHIYSKK